MLGSCISQLRYIANVRSRYPRAAARAASLLAPTIRLREANAVPGAPGASIARASR